MSPGKGPPRRSRSKKSKIFFLRGVYVRVWGPWRAPRPQMFNGLRYEVFVSYMALSRALPALFLSENGSGVGRAKRVPHVQGGGQVDPPRGGATGHEYPRRPPWGVPTTGQGGVWCAPGREARCPSVPAHPPVSGRMSDPPGGAQGGRWGVWRQSTWTTFQGDPAPSSARSYRSSASRSYGSVPRGTVTR